MYDLMYSHLQHVLSTELQYRKVAVSTVLSKDKPNHPTSHEFCGRQFTTYEPDKLPDYTIVYIGWEGSSLTNIVLTFNQTSVCSEECQQLGDLQLTPLYPGV